MPTLDIGGQKVSVGDDFMSLTPEQQQSTVEEIAGSLPKAARPDGAMETANVATGGMIRGVPILGPAIDSGIRKAAAGTRSLIHGTPYADELKAVNDYADQNAAAHPNIETAANLAGGVASTIPVAMTGPGAAALGLTGKTLATRIGAGAASGAVIGGADSAVRGEDIGHGAGIGFGLGAAAPVAGKVLGGAYSKIRGAMRPAEPIVPQNTIDVNGTKVPVRESVLTRNADTSLTEQARLNGGGQAQEIARAAEEGTQSGMAKAHADLAASLDPTGTQPRAAPLEAGQAVAKDLVAQEEARAAAEVARISGAANERLGLKAEMEPPTAPRPPAPAATVETPYSMGETISNGIQDRFQEARAARTAAYDRLAAIPGEYEPAVFARAGNAIRDRLNTGPIADRVRITERLTPNAADALSVIDNDLGRLQFENQARQGPAVPITNADVEGVRKQLVSLQRQANQTARAPGGSAEDARAMRRVIEEFDAHKERGIQAGGFSGDGEAVLRTGQQARALHTELRRNFSSQGPGDKVGRTIEDIIGRYPGQEITPDKIVQHILGSASEPGGGNTVQLTQRLRGLLGENSPEWAAIRKAALGHMTEAPAGLDPIPHGVQADRIMNLLNGTKGRLLAQTLFSPAERVRLADHAANLRASEPVPVSGLNSVEKTIARWSGRTDGVPASGKEIIDGLLNAERGTAAKLAKELKTRLSPESWHTFQQGLFSKITEAPEGATPFGYQKIGENLAKFLNTELAQETYTANQRTMMKALADAYHKLVPIPGTTNPSGSAIMGKKMMTGLRSQVLGMIGFSHGGLPGAGVGIALDKALTWGAERKAAKDATRLFYGEQPKSIRDVKMSQQLERLTAASIRGSQSASR